MIDCKNIMLDPSHVDALILILQIGFVNVTTTGAAAACAAATTVMIPECSYIGSCPTKHSLNMY